MLSIFKKIFGKTEPQPAAPRVAMPRAVAAAAPADASQARPQVEVAHLSLAAILTKLPEDLKRNVVRVPDPSVTVALPVATIHKQLPSGSVKMSLASLYRQAPAGIFANQPRVEDKRMVEVPLQEVFRHVKPQGLRRRNDQRRVDLPNDAYELFSDRENPYAIAPGVATAEPEMESEPEPAPPIPQPRALQPSNDLRAGNGHGAYAPAPQASAPVAAPRAVGRPAAQAPVARAAAPAPAPAAPAGSDQPPVFIPIASLCDAWPEPIRSEALAMDSAKVGLPVSLLTSGVAKGKVAFSWGQIRAWVTPPVSAPTEARDATELLLPLKVVAPAFLAHQRGGGAAPRKKFELDESIPALFSGGEAAKPVAPEPEPAPAPALATIPAPASLVSPSVEAEPEPEPEAAAPEIAAPQFAEPEPEPAPAPEPAPPAEAPQSIPAPAFLAFAPSEPVAAPQVAPPVEEAPQPQPQANHAPAHAAEHRVPHSIGEILGREEKQHWTPQDLLKAATTLPGVKGACIGLDEGLLVAADLPEEVKGDIVAAFLPQMFARLNNYTGEMKFGQVNELLFTTHEAHFQAYKLGDVYFGVLGKPGESLPWEGLRLIADQLVRQTSK